LSTCFARRIVPYEALRVAQHSTMAARRVAFQQRDGRRVAAPAALEEGVIRGVATGKTTQALLRGKGNDLQLWAAPSLVINVMNDDDELSDM